MFRKFTSRTYCVLPAILCLSLSISVLLVGCSRFDEPAGPTERLADASEMIVYETDSTEWVVQLFKEHLFYSEAAAITLPAPWRLPDKSEAQFLRTFTYPYGSERFVTCDGYTFGMPSASVSKAGTKTKYSVLGLWIRKTTIDVPF